MKDITQTASALDKRIGRLLSELVSFDTTSCNSNLDLIRYVEQYLEGLGVSCRLVHDDSGSKANLYATVGPEDRSGVMLSGHTDVVPVDGQDWSTDPFAVTAKAGALFGRGTADMKGLLPVRLPGFRRCLKTAVGACAYCALLRRGD